MDLGRQVRRVYGVRRGAVPDSSPLRPTQRELALRHSGAHRAPMIFVTGAAGFIGSVLLRSLYDAGYHDLIAVDRLGSTEKWRNLVGKRVVDYVDHALFLERIEHGVYDRERVQAIVHIGARTDTTERDLDLLMRLNFDYTRRLCLWAHKRGVPFIYASSASVYGDGAQGFADDDFLTPRLRPLNGYAFTKWLFDHWVLEQGLQNAVVGLRFFNVYGPNEYHKARMASVINHAYPTAKREGLVKLFESDRPGIAHGDQKRDFVYVKDISRVVLHFLRHPHVHGIYNLGSGRARTFNDLARALLSACGKSPDGIRYFPMPDDLKGKYQYFTEADLSKLRDAGFAEPMTALEDGVGDYVRGYLEKPEPWL